MHASLRALLPQTASGAALSRQKASDVLSLPTHTFLDVLALARIACSVLEVKPFTCGIINAKSGRCAENCAFCAQSAHHVANSPVYPLLQREALLERAEGLVAAGARYMGIVISGATPSVRDFERLYGYAEYIRNRCNISLCASFGLLRADQAVCLKQAGFAGYHHNLETAPSFYAEICSTHSLEIRIQTVCHAKTAGLRVCSGGIFGMGESWDQRLELSEILGKLDVDSIPVNFLNPIPGTPLQNRLLLPPREALSIVALLRLMHPHRDLVVCGGRSKTLGAWESMLFSAGANGLMVGDYLTTKGSPLDKDKTMLEVLGLLPQQGRLPLKKSICSGGATA